MFSSKRRKLLHICHIWCVLSICTTIGSATSAQDTKAEKSEAAPVPIEQQIAELDAQLKNAAQSARESRTELVELQRQHFDLNLKLKDLETRLQSLDQTQLEGRQKIQQLLVDSGQWISFSQKIAPILRDHCLTCHNARNPQGQFIVATYSSLIGSGESGPAVEPGQAEKSRLYQLVADHSMPPEDSSRITAEQIDLIKRWIDLGARLDWQADPEASIFRLAPRVEQIQPPDHYPAPIPITAVAVSQDGQLIATSGYYEVLLWAAADGKLVQRIPGAAQRVHAIEFLSDSKRIVVASGTPGSVGEARAFDLSTGKPIADLLFCQDSALCLAVSPDGKQLAVGETSGALTVFAIQEDAFPQLYRIEDHSDWINAITWSPDGKWIATASRDKTCKVFNASNGKLQITFNGHAQPVSSVLFGEDNQQVLSVGEDSRLRIWNISEGNQLHELKGLDGVSRLLRVDEEQCVVFGGEKDATLVDSNNGKRVKRIKLSEALFTSGRFSVDHHRLFLGSFDGKVHCIDWSKPSKEVVFQATP